MYLAGFFAAAILLVSILITAGFFIAVFLEVRARGTFWKCHAAAVAAGVEKVFMEKFNSIANYGDNLNSVISRWGTRRIRQMYADSVNHCPQRED